MSQRAPLKPSSSSLARINSQVRLTRARRSPRRRATRKKSKILGRYQGPDGSAREIVAQTGLAGSVLVIDHDAETQGDRRLVAHLFPDEPPENAALVCRHYLSDPRGRHCRGLRPEDLGLVPCDHLPDSGASAEAGRAVEPPGGLLHRLEPVACELEIPELRWRRRSLAGDGVVTVSVRQVVGYLESYEPVRAMTAAALVCHSENQQLSLSSLRAELDRLNSSPIVLNRGLRRAVLAIAQAEGLSMSEIATRCGRVKRDRRGNQSGETSWLARRLGLAPEGGSHVRTPWIHSEVLALIARQGLGISPHEVELD